MEAQSIRYSHNNGCPLSVRQNVLVEAIENAAKYVRLILVDRPCGRTQPDDFTTGLRGGLTRLYLRNRIIHHHLSYTIK